MLSRTCESTVGKNEVICIGVRGGDGVERRARLDSAANDDEPDMEDMVRCRSWFDRWSWSCPALCVTGIVVTERADEVDVRRSCFDACDDWGEVSGDPDAVFMLVGESARRLEGEEAVDISACASSDDTAARGVRLAGFGENGTP